MFLVGMVCLFVYPAVGLFETSVAGGKVSPGMGIQATFIFT